MPAADSGRRRGARALRTRLERLRFVLWVARLRLEMRRRGGRLVVEAPWGARLQGRPRLHVAARGDGDRTLRVRLGRGVVFGRDTSLRIDAHGGNLLDLGDGVVLEDGVRLWLFSGAVRIGRQTILRDQVVLKTKGELVVGEFVRIGYSTVVHCHERVDLSDRVVLADNITVVDSDHIHDGTDTWFMHQDVRAAPVQIGRNTLVGANSVITRGAHVGRNAVVAAGSVVRAADYPDGWLVAGVPAKPVRALQEEPPEG